MFLIANDSQSNLMEVKNLIKKYCDRGIVDNKMSEVGFLFLHTIFVQKGRWVAQQLNGLSKF